MIHAVLQLGAPSLRQPSMPIPIEQLQTEFYQTLIDDLLETMRARNGAGIAAPQIGHNVQIMIFEITKNPRYPEAEPVPLTILINPSFEPLDEAQQSGYEGCLSVGDLRGIVARFQHIRYQGLDRHGNTLERTVSGFHARVFQHEFDHLQGTLFVDRIEDTKTLGFLNELKASGAI